MDEMNERVKQTLLYDFYGELLNKHQKEIYEQYLLEDLSLGEIASVTGTSRQAVHDLIKRCNSLLTGYEAKLHLVDKFLLIKDKVKNIESVLDNAPNLETAELIAQIHLISEEIIEEL